jgi:hypothetical protein
MKSAGFKAISHTDPSWSWGLAIGFLPVASALLFRTYSYHVSPFWYEELRQFDTIFVVFELAIIAFARSAQFDVKKLWRSLPVTDQIATAIFLITFWISSVFVSDVPALSVIRVLIWLVHLGFACAVFHLTGARSSVSVDRFAKASFVGLCAYVPLLAVHFAFLPDPASLPGQEIIWSSAVPGYLSVRLFGFTTAALALLAIGLLWHRNRFSRADWWLHAGFILSLTLTFWSGTRGGYYAVILASFALPFIARRMPTKVWVVSLVSGTVVAGGLSLQLFQPDSSFGLFGHGGELGNGFSSGRYEIWIRSLQLIAARPLFGWGESAIWWLLENNPGHQQPHNALLQMLLNWGAIATSAAVYLLFRVARILVGQAAHQPILLTPVVVLTGLAIMSSVDGILYNPRTMMLVIFAGASSLAMALQARRGEHAELVKQGDGAVVARSG